jgi:hypothetical protein
LFAARAATVDYAGIQITMPFAYFVADESLDLLPKR